MTVHCGSGVIALSGFGTGMGQYRPAGPLTHRPAGPLDPAVAAPARRQAEPRKSQPASGGNADTRIHHPAPQRRKSGSHRAWYKCRYSGSTREAIPKGSTIRYPVLSDILCGPPSGPILSTRSTDPFVSKLVIICLTFSTLARLMVEWVEGNQRKEVV